jgi:DNA-binding CsgD family transcriptional regulator
MLTIIKPIRTLLDRAEYMPPFLQPVADAIKQNAPLEPPIDAIVRNFGFETFMYGISASAHPDQESKTFVFTTLPRAWVSRYDQQAYIEIDPRVRRALESAIPLIWDQTTERGYSDRVDAFLEDAAAHGVASGVAFGIHDARAGLVAVALNSSQAELDDARRAAIAKNLGDIILFGIYFHEIFIRAVVHQGVPPKSEGAPLTSRERQCLLFAAHGLTSVDIATRLGIAERTVEFHFAGIRSKLAAANRQEAVAKAMAAGLISP